MPGHLIHIGFPKAGSTALSAWFDAHPQLVHAPNGLGGFYHAFDLAAAAAGADEPAPWHVTSSEALSFPRLTDDPVARARGTPPRAVTLTEGRERVCRMLRVLAPGATILIVTRGFRAAILSGYSQHIKTGGRTIARELRPLEDLVAEALDYDAVVRLYEAAFGSDQVLVLPYELLRDDAAAFTGALEQRLGLEPSGMPIGVRNAGLSPAGLVWQHRTTAAVALVARGLPGRAGDRLVRASGRLGASGRLQRPFDVLDRVVPGSRAAPVEVPADVLEPLRGRAGSLATRPFYERYAEAYLNDA